MDTEYKLGKGKIYVLVRFTEPKTIKIFLGEKGNNMLKFTPNLWYEFLKCRYGISTLLKDALMVTSEGDKMKLLTTDGSNCLLEREDLDSLLKLDENIMHDISVLYMERIFYDLLLKKLKKIQEDERSTTRIDWACELISEMIKTLNKNKSVPEDNLEYYYRVSKGIHSLDFEQLADEMVKKKLECAGYMDERMRKEIDMGDHVLYKVCDFMDSNHG
ncbi:hypothetical protein TNIN_468971 [Trichonephila inaurata madagascariensis]|uniref:Uncharacterized protein n=1 Tax=Trichonephila inaurata madagascariensis TaxID=2747483 RepID=A0A8X6Y9Z6_9ARAC|nr:hypothetical protein TNIN_468971 [Trichonephila inaurata madagascariensis]